MLTDLHIRDYAIVDEVELELGSGLTVLTGETGAGKSILVGALGLVLGDRADSGAVRHGARRAEVSASFAVDTLPEIAAWLEAQALEAGDELLLRRVVTREGRSRAFVNGASVPAQTLRELGRRLLDIHGQQAHQSLLRRSVQRAIVDHHGRLAEVLAPVGQRYREWHELAQERERLRAASPGRDDRLTLLGQQVGELEALGLEDGELEALEDEHKRLANVEKLVAGAQTALACLDGEEGESARELLNRARHALGESAVVDARLQAIGELVDGARVQLDEATGDLERYLTSLEVEPDRLGWVETRLAGIHDLARKHRVPARQLGEHAAILREELAAAAGASTRLEQLERGLDAAERGFRDAARELSRARGAAATALARQITAAIHQLGMPEGLFQVEVAPADGEQPRPHGLDRIEFHVSTNAGQPPGPLAKIASGGELARISLALEAAAADATRIPCMVFDEVDSGIGGGVAEIVGRQLRALAAHRQVLCVTHLPQVASQAHRHVQVSKVSDGGRARAVVKILDEGEKLEELARMLGGVRITRRTREHAREMLERAQK